MATGKHRFHHVGVVVYRTVVHPAAGNFWDLATCDASTSGQLRDRLMGHCVPVGHAVDSLPFIGVHSGLHRPLCLRTNTYLGCGRGLGGNHRAMGGTNETTCLVLGYEQPRTGPCGN